ncbi:MAG: nuclear transport factor 2 family protein, partial [Actinobacteria bacterium]|nr:nuclear transport factor 2 family protein [Actinomycetota bacterium]
ADVLEAWRAAWNACDADALSRLADDKIELVTPLGVRQGLSALRDLVARQTFGVRLYVGPQTYRFKGDTAVSVGPVEWRSVDEDDAVVERQDDGAAAFTFRNDRIARFKPFPDADTALRAEGFSGPRHA